MSPDPLALTKPDARSCPNNCPLIPATMSMVDDEIWCRPQKCLSCPSALARCHPWKALNSVMWSENDPEENLWRLLRAAFFNEG